MTIHVYWNKKTGFRSIKKINTLHTLQRHEIKIRRCKNIFYCFRDIIDVKIKGKNTFWNPKFIKKIIVTGKRMTYKSHCYTTIDRIRIKYILE